jgi:hypothetical protein
VSRLNGITTSADGQTIRVTFTGPSHGARWGPRAGSFLTFGAGKPQRPSAGTAEQRSCAHRGALERGAGRPGVAVYKVAIARDYKEEMTESRLTAEKSRPCSGRGPRLTSRVTVLIIDSRLLSDSVDVAMWKVSRSTPRVTPTLVARAACRCKDSAEFAPVCRHKVNG